MSLPLSESDGFAVTKTLMLTVSKFCDKNVFQRRPNVHIGPVVSILWKRGCSSREEMPQTPCDCLECRKNREEAIPHEKRNLRLVSEMSISMLLEMLYIDASRNAIYLCFIVSQNASRKGGCPSLKKKDCSLKSTKMSAHGIQTFPWEERPCRKSASTESMAAQLKAKLATQ